MSKSPVPARVREWIAKDVQYAELMLMTHGEVRPLAALHSADGIRLAMLDTSSEEAKDLSATLINALCIAWDVDMLVMLTEAWISQLKDEEVDDFRKRVGAPSRDPNRKEVVTVHAAWRQDGRRRSAMAIHEVQRDAEGKPTGLSLNIVPEEDIEAEASGRFYEMFPDRKPSAAFREEMRRYIEETMPPGLVEKIH